MNTTQAAEEGPVPEQAKEVAGQAREQAEEVARKAGGRVRSQVDERSTEVGERVVSQAEDVRSIGASLREQGNDSAAQLADQAAERIEQVGAWLRDSDAERMLEQTEDAARRNPWAVLAGSVATGFAISRVLKASSADRYRNRTSNGGSQTPNPASWSPEPTTPRTGRFDRMPSPAEAPITGTAPQSGTTPMPPESGPGTGMGAA